MKIKANEIAKRGYYWYRTTQCEAWGIGLVEDDTFFYGCGTDEFETVPFASGVLADAEFVGPIEPPSAVALSEDEIVALAGLAGFKTADIAPDPRLNPVPGDTLRAGDDSASVVTVQGVSWSPFVGEGKVDFICRPTLFILGQPVDYGTLPLVVWRKLAASWSVVALGKR